MNEHLREFVSSRGVAMRIDREQGVIRGVKLLGLESRNGRRYLPAALTQAAPLYEGAKVNVNHPKGHPLAARDYQDRLGSIRNVSTTAEGLFGDLHFNPKHALAEQLLWDAVHAPENVGFSHNVEARTARHEGQTVVEAILKVQSVDLVADPATTRGLYESADSGVDADRLLAQLTLEQLSAARPDLLRAISGQAAGRLGQLEAEVERLRAGEAMHLRRQRASDLLEEFKLPRPGASEPALAAIVSPLFFEALLAAPDEAAMRALVAERAEMIATARRLGESSTHARGPISREQGRSELAGERVRDGRSFAKAIT